MMTVVAVLTISSTVFAGSKDLKIITTLMNAGAASEQFMSQVHVGLDNLECAYSNISKEYDCNMDDISANGGEGARLEFSGKKAKSVFNLLAAAGAPSDGGMGKVFVSAKSIRCSQSIKEVADGYAARRTSCSIDISAE